MSRADMTTKSFLDNMVQAGLVLVLLLSPLPFGSVHDGWVFFLESAICLLLLLWAASEFTAGTVSIVRTPVWTVLLILAAYILLTLVAAPAGLLRLLSEETAEAYAIAGRILAMAGTSMVPVKRIALDGFGAEGEILKAVAYAAFFFLCLHSFRDRRRFLILYSLLIVTGTSLALLGIAQALWSNGKIYWKYESGSGMPFGPFANHNHFAGYLEMTLGLCVGMFLAEIEEYRKLNPQPGFSGYFSWLWRTDGARVWLLFLGAFVQITALAASLSRGGVLSFLAAAGIFCTAGLVSRPKSDRVRGRPAGRQRKVLIAACLGGILLWVGILAWAPRARARWENSTDSAAAYRMQVWRDGLRAFTDYPVVGAGLGSFRTLFPRYKTSTFSSETTHAENEYLQWAIETGTVGFLLMSAMALVFLTGIVWRLKSRRDSYLRDLTLGALLAITSIGIHNFMDFNMHIPSNALTFAAVAALCMLAANYHRGIHGDRYLFSMSTYPLRSVAGGAILGGLLLLALISGYRAWMRYDSVRLQGWWLQNPPGAGAEPDLSLLRQAGRKAPGNGTTFYLQAVALEGEAAKKRLFDFESRLRLLEGAQLAIVQAIATQPADASYWAMLGRIESTRQRYNISDEAFGRAVALSPANGYIRRDYGISLVQSGRIEQGASQLVIARTYASELNLMDLLQFLSTRTADRKIWESIVRYDPGDLAVYAGFLRSHGFTDAGDQFQKEAAALGTKSK
jgi:O-antigen ligase